MKWPKWGIFTIIKGDQIEAPTAARLGVDDRCFKLPKLCQFLRILGRHGIPRLPHPFQDELIECRGYRLHHYLAHERLLSVSSGFGFLVSLCAMV